MFPCMNCTGPTGCRPSIAGRKLCLDSSRWRSKFQDGSHKFPCRYGPGPAGSRPSIAGQKLCLDSSSRWRSTGQVSHVPVQVWYRSHRLPTNYCRSKNVSRAAAGGVLNSRTSPTCFRAVTGKISQVTDHILQVTKCV
jgi:hypothetical protein